MFARVIGNDLHSVFAALAVKEEVPVPGPKEKFAREFSQTTHIPVASLYLYHKKSTKYNHMYS